MTLENRTLFPAKSYCVADSACVLMTFYSLFFTAIFLMTPALPNFIFFVCKNLMAFSILVFLGSTLFSLLLIYADKKGNKIYRKICSIAYFFRQPIFFYIQWPGTRVHYICLPFFLFSGLRHKEDDMFLMSGSFRRTPALADIVKARVAIEKP